MSEHLSVDEVCFGYATKAPTSGYTRPGISGYLTTGNGNQDSETTMIYMSECGYLEKQFGVRLRHTVCPKWFECSGSDL